MEAGERCIELGRLRDLVNGRLIMQMSDYALAASPLKRTYAPDLNMRVNKAEVLQANKRT